MHNRALNKLAKTTVVLILTALGLDSCNRQEFPSEISSAITAEHFRIKDTQLFVKQPKSFSYIDGANAFVNDSTVIQCMVSKTNFYENLKYEQFSFFLNKSYTLVEKETFKINDLPGIYYELKENNKHYFYFIFGDSMSQNMIIGILPKKNDHREIIFEFVKSCVYDKAVEIDPLENIKFHFYPSIIGFNFYSKTLNQYIFLEEDYEKYYEANEKYNYISLAQASGNSSIKDIDAFHEIMYSSILDQGVTMKKVLNYDTFRIDKQYAKAIAFEAESEGNDMIIYMLSTGKQGNLVMISGSFYHDGIELVTKLHSIALEIKLKK